MSQGNSTILFSATMLPIRYYKTLLSGNEDDYAIYANSALRGRKTSSHGCDGRQQPLLQAQRERIPGKVAEYIREVVLSKSGNYMIFFPSYQYMEQVEYALEDMDFPADLLVQGQGMKEQERQEFLEEFEKPRDHSLAAFCVMGGVFSEGIDLKKERLIGAVIVGTGLPMVCVEQEVLRGYFEEKEEEGFDFAYQYPGMNKVLQAAGRVIRTTEDEGIILLLDDRFLKKEYLELFPREWEHFQMVNRKNVGQCLSDFWESRGR